MRRPRYAVRADHDRHVYEVYLIDTDETVETFAYKAGSESDRGTAMGRASLTRERLNSAARWSNR